MVYPIACLEGIANRCAGQLYRGERTRISWTASEIVLPTIAGAASSGAIVRVAGITGRIRGMKYKRPDGRTVRPEFVVVDDPQTSESAGSAEQTRTTRRRASPPAPPSRPASASVSSRATSSASPAPDARSPA